MEPTSEQLTDALSIDDIEAAYQRALETAEVAESLFPIPVPDADLDEVHSSDLEISPESRSEDEEPSVDPDFGVAQSEPADRRDEEEPLSPAQVVEALLFVGGDPLPAKKMGDVLGGRFSHEQVDELVADLNTRYARQTRPYEIRLIEGGYQLSLRPEFESVRRRVYGQGPKEVKLAQDALEVLAFVAYRQPVTKQAVEETERKNVGGILRQLLRRELLTIERGENETYHTTPRFLQLFGLASLDDLPRAADFDFK